MVVCIFAVLVIGAITVGLISYYGPNTWNINQATTDFSFEAEAGTINETVTLDIAITTGSIAITFVDNESLLYKIDIKVLNTTLETDGAPTVSFASNTIGLDYTTGGVNITLGSGVNYTLNIDVTTGSIAAIFGVGANIGDVTLQTTTGGVNLIMTDDVTLLGNATFDISVTTGSIAILAALPTDVGGSIECAVTTGDVDIIASGWTEITANHYETSDYDTASQTLTIIAQTTVGSVDAVMT